MNGLESNENKRIETVKGLSSTRWSAYAPATKALRLNFRNIHGTLTQIAGDASQKSESKARSLSLSQEYRTTRPVKGTTEADDSNEPDPVNEGKDKFCVETFFVIIDKLINALQQRHTVYKETSKYFGFLTRLEKLSLSEIREQSVRLRMTFPTK